MTELKANQWIISITTIGISTALTIAYLLKSKKPLEPNPFAFDSREELQPFVTDKNKRDSVLKNGYSRKKLSLIGSDFDIIIIGSGEMIIQIFFLILFRDWKSCGCWTSISGRKESDHS
jgi:hypothetical protein